jgi:hypothetical protein
MRPRIRWILPHLYALSVAFSVYGFLFTNTSPFIT